MKKIILLILSALLFTALLMLCTYGDDALTYAESAPGGTVTNTEELIAAFGVSSYGQPNAELLVGSKTDIRLNNSIILDKSIIIKEGSYTIVGGGCTLARSEGCGAVFVVEGGSLSIERPMDDSFDFSDNTEPNFTFDGREMNGEPFIKVGNGASLFVNQKVYVKNMISTAKGGFIYAENSQKVEIKACRFENCKAKDGGAVAFVSNSEKTDGMSLSIKKSSFKNCSAENGGVVFSDVFTEVVNCNFASNTASENGGALVLNGNSEITSVIGSENKAKKGGFIYNTGTSAVVDIEASNNEAELGGAIYNKNSLLTSQIYFYENIAIDKGGAVYNEGAFYYNGGSMMGNEAAAYGGGVYCTKGSHFKIESGDITSSIAKYAAGVYTEGSLSMSGGAIGKNKGEAPQIAVMGSMEMSGAAVCYGGDVIGLIKGADGNIPYIALKGVLTNKDRQYVAVYSKTDDGFKRKNDSGVKIFDGKSDEISSAINVFSVETGGLLPHKISPDGFMSLAFPTVLAIIVVSAAALCAVGMAFYKKRKSKAEKVSE